MSSFTLFNMVAGFLKHTAFHGEFGMRRTARPPRRRRRPGAAAGRGITGDPLEAVIHPGSPLYDSWCHAVAHASAWRSAPTPHLPEFLAAALLPANAATAAGGGGRAAQAFPWPGASSVVHGGRQAPREGGWLPAALPGDAAAEAVELLEAELAQLSSKGPDLGQLLIAALQVRSLCNDRV